ncbi:MAG: hypothetical protein ACP5N5_04035 [Desulfurococcus sp.]|uniref:hypothetical protein n=1 Tax=Desulfurococcus sp. TaxID=51678 RepID=UPI003D0A63B0
MPALTIYWERCDVCGYYRPVKQCTLFQNLLVDAVCCISCPKRSECPRPVWRVEAVLEKPAQPRLASPEERRRLLMELLGKLSSESRAPSA